MRQVEISREHVGWVLVTLARRCGRAARGVAKGLLQLGIAHSFQYSGSTAVR